MLAELAPFSESEQHDFGLGASASPSPEPKHDFGLGASASPSPEPKHDFGLGASASPSPEPKHDFGLCASASPSPKPKHDFGLGASVSPSPEPKHDFGLRAALSASPQRRSDFGLGATSSPSPVRSGIHFTPSPSFSHFQDASPLPNAEDFGALPVPEKGPSQFSTHQPTEASEPFGSSSKEDSEFLIVGSYMYLTLVHADWKWGEHIPSPINVKVKGWRRQPGEVEPMDESAC